MHGSALHQNEKVFNRGSGVMTSTHTQSGAVFSILSISCTWYDGEQ
jgi:hypothetical protein